MKLKIERGYLKHLQEVYLPNIIHTGRLLAELHPVSSREYLVNLIAAEVLEQISLKFQKKVVNTTGYWPVVVLTAAEALALFVAMINYPIAPHLEWDNMKRDTLIAALDQWRANPMAPITFHAK